jgi:TonB family protein
VRVGARTVAISFGVFDSALRSASAQDSLSLSGTVRDSLGAAIVGAQVVVPSGRRASSDDHGRFVLAALPGGTVHVTIRRLGFLPISVDWLVAPGSPPLDVRLAAIAQSLAAVEVREHREPYDARLAGFNARRARKAGHFLTRSDLERKNGFNLTDVIRDVPGARVITMRGALGKTVLLRGATCPPLVFIDGFPASAGPFDLDMVNLKTIEGIEVYSGAASIPMELIGPRGLEQCGVIAIWSRPAGPRRVAPARTEATVDVQPLIESHEVRLATEVDTEARYIAGSAEPLYPDSLWRAHMDGHVIAQFVVDSAGAVETGTVTIVASSHPEFAAAVRAAVPAARFEPAVARGRRVRQLVQQSFNFSLTTEANPPKEERSRPTRDSTPVSR